MLDYIRIACAVPDVKVGDVKKNVDEICRYMADADGKNIIEAVIKLYSLVIDCWRQDFLVDFDPPKR